MINLTEATEELAQRLADAQRLPLDAAIREALEYRARSAGIDLRKKHERDASTQAVTERKARFDAMTEYLAGLPISDARSPRQIMDDLDDL